MLSLRHNSRFLYLLLLLTISCTSKIALSRLALKLSTFSRKHLLNQKSHGHESLLANRYSHGKFFLEDIFMISRTGQPTTRKQKPMIVNQSFFDSLKVCTEKIKIKKVNIN